MEDSVTENEKSQVLRSSRDYEDEKQGGAKEVIINGTEDDVEGGREQDEGEKQGKEDRNDHHVEEKPIGVIKQIISSFGPGDKEQDEGEKEIKVSEEKEEEKRGGGGLFSRIIMGSSPRDDKQAGKDVIDNAKTPEKQGNGVIDNIVSNLPPSLPDDAAPASDEACILIHSIIHD